MSIEKGPIPVPEDAPLWRYVSLSTLFLYVSGRAAVPSIRSLRECDPTEGLKLGDHVRAMGVIDPKDYHDLEEYVRKHRMSESQRQTFDLNRSQDTQPSGPTFWPDYGGNQSVVVREYFEMLETTRYAWCWFNSGQESAAMWQTYGQHGAAVRTSVRKLLEVLSGQGRHWLSSGVQYLDGNRFAVPPSAPHWRPWIRRPFLLKRLEYEHEKEVRFVTISGKACPRLLLDGLVPESWIEQIVLWPGFGSRGREAEALVEALGKVSSELANRTRVSTLFERVPSRAQPVRPPSDSLRKLGEYFPDIPADWPDFMKKP